MANYRVDDEDFHLNHSGVEHHDAAGLQFQLFISALCRCYFKFVYAEGRHAFPPNIIWRKQLDVSLFNEMLAFDADRDVAEEVLYRVGRVALRKLAEGRHFPILLEILFSVKLPKRLWQEILNEAVSTANLEPVLTLLSKHSHLQISYAALSKLARRASSKQGLSGHANIAPLMTTLEEQGRPEAKQLKEIMLGLMVRRPVNSRTDKMKLGDCQPMASELMSTWGVAGDLEEVVKACTIPVPEIILTDRLPESMVASALFDLYGGFFAENDFSGSTHSRAVFLSFLPDEEGRASQAISKIHVNQAEIVQLVAFEPII